jgi:hypothetical protein
MSIPILEAPNQPGLLVVDGLAGKAMERGVSLLGLHIRFYLKSLRAFLDPGVPLHLSVTDLDSNT